MKPLQFAVIGAGLSGLACARRLVAAGHVERARKALSQHSLTCETFSGVDENPTTLHVDAGLRGVDVATLKDPGNVRGTSRKKGACTC